MAAAPAPRFSRRGNAGRLRSPTRKAPPLPRAETPQQIAKIRTNPDNANGARKARKSRGKTRSCNIPTYLKLAFFIRIEKLLY
ncbi:MAG: hypothetical protein DBX55_03875 [Verrucomicrobia bacterium]|nr:MAG: hypothetical protein DBX55_03875 [Verrucomicrobiota bacterium]